MFKSHQDALRHSRTRNVQLNSFRNNLEKSILCNYISYKYMYACCIRCQPIVYVRIDMVLHVHGQCSCSHQTRPCIIYDQYPAHFQTQSQHLNLVQTLTTHKPQPQDDDKCWQDAGAIGSLQNRPDKRLDLWPMEKPNKKHTTFQNCIKWVCLRTIMEKA